MNHQEAWLIVGGDVWNCVKYVLPPIGWASFTIVALSDLFKFHEEAYFLALIFILVITLSATYWSYQ